MKILLTGSSQGIGKAIYEKLITEHEVYTINRCDCGDNNFLCDLSDIAAVTALCKDIGKENWDVLINNAGGSFPCAFENLTASDVQNRLNLNFVAPVLLMQVVLPKMKENGFGRVINISSVTAKSPVPYIHIYGAAKSALNSMTKSLSLYYMDSNICINSICPGSVDTITSVEGRKEISRLRFGNELAEVYQDNMVANNGIGRMLQPIEIANMVEFLLSSSANCITGQTINVCGNMEMN